MSKLTKYWRRKMRAVRVLLNGQPSAGGYKATITSWIVDLSGSDNDDAPITGLAGDLHDKLAALIPARDNVTGADNEYRRSARLVNMVQRAIGARPGGNGFFASVADVADPHVPPVIPFPIPPAPATPADYYHIYLEKVREASIAAAAFLDRAQNKGSGGPTAIAAALTELNKLGSLKPWVKEEIENLIKAIENSKAAKGGSGEGSANWPSSWVSSSSGS